MGDFPGKLDVARGKIQQAFTRAGVSYPSIQYRTKATTGANPARGITGTVANTDTSITGCWYRPASLGAIARSGGLIEEGSIVLEQLSLTVTAAMLEAARTPADACFVVNGLEFRVVSFRAEPAESPLWWTVTCNKAT